MKARLGFNVGPPYSTFAVATAFLWALAAAAVLIWNSEQYRLQKERLLAHGQAGDYAHALQVGIERALSANYALAALVRQGNGNIPDFEHVVNEMLPFYPGASALALSPGGIVHFSAPVSENLKSIGLDQFHDPAQNKEALLARETGRLTLAGPFELAQGGLGVVGRLPVFLNDDKSQAFFWGFTNVVIRFPDALKPAGLHNLAARGYAYELWRINPNSGQKQIIAASPSTVLNDPVIHAVPVPNATWHLSIAPVLGWYDPAGLLFKCALGLLFGMLTGSMVKLLIQLRTHKQALEGEVAERIREISASQNQLQTILAALPDMLFEVDLDGRIHAYHSPRTELPVVPPEVFLGLKFMDVIPPEAANVCMSALYEANEKGISKGKQYALELSSGKCWFELSVSRKSCEQPHFIVLARDITERVAANLRIQRLSNFYAALSQCNEAIVRCVNEDELFPQICRSAVRFGHMKMAWVGLIDPAAGIVRPVAGFGDGAYQLEDIHIAVDPDTFYGRGPVGTAIREDRPIWCQDFLHDSSTAAWHELGARSGWKASAALPLHRNGAVIGSFNLYFGELNALDDEVQNLLIEMAMDISYALDAFEAERRRISLTGELQQTRERLESILGNIDQAIWSIDVSTGQVLFLSIAAEAIYGRPVQEFYDTPDLWLKVMHPDDVGLVIEMDGTVRAQGKAEAEYRILRPNGEVRWLRDHARRIDDESGAMIRLDGVVSDITERKLIEEAVRERDARYRIMFQANPLPMWVYDLQSLRFLAVNDAALNHYGYSQEEFFSMTVEDIRLPEDIPRLRDAPENKVKHGIGKDGIWRHRKRDRTLIDVEITSHRFGFGGIDAVLVLAHDVTDRLKAEAQLRLAAKIFEQSTEGFVITDTENNIVMVNQAFTAITGYSEVDVIGYNPRILASGLHGRDFFEGLWNEVNKKGYWQGELWNRRKDGKVYPEWLIISPLLDDQGNVINYIGSFNDISHYKAAQEDIQRLAHFDTLTGLPNRTLLHDRVNQAIGQAKRSQAQLAFLFVDLDHFKNINDSLGHHIGDELLSLVAQRMKSMMREQDTVSRQGGDEFILILPNTNADGAAFAASKLLAALARPYFLQQYELVVTPSIGIAIYPADGENFESLAQCADVAMYRAKSEGRNSYCFFSSEMHANSVRKLHLQNALHRALELGQLQVFYQPQIALQTGQVVGVEALLRWRHPEWGMISPAEFIPIAEDCGQIIPIGEWVLRSAVRQLKIWMDSGLRPITMAVNLSAVQFRQAGLPALVTQILVEEQMPAHYLELELTERVAMNNAPGAIAVMDKLHECGVRMSIDDFGTGYSSMSYLKRFKVYKLKIDQSFVSDVTQNSEDKAIVLAIINLSRNLGFQTIAEGVETEEQLAFLREHGCDEVQGYYFSRPLAGGEVEEFLREHEGRDGNNSARK